ncbi:MAG: heterodisulfide reductase-related iron-sulfur binding cluster [Sulfobacillus sp.]|nr:heterodisulfide reductase-related iron-sulfur binding cluster [Sulfobacillus sp.]
MRNTEGRPAVDTGQCVHCGLCLSVCPTYQETGLEAESPRGRVFLLEHVRENPASLNASAMKALDDCLDCRACESVCPSHVATGHLVEQWRAESAVRLQEEGPEAMRLFRRVSRPLTFFLGSPRGLKWFQRLARLSQKPLVGRWVTRLRFVPPAAEGLVRGLPARIPRTLSRVRRPRNHPPGARRVMLFVGCIMDTVYAETNQHTQDLIEMGGVGVVIPDEQRCCGALHMHGGAPEVTKRWAQENIAAFEASGAEAVVVNAAGCGAMLKEYAELFDPEDAWHERAKRFQSAVVDATVFLADLSLPEIPPTERAVTVHDPCHLAHAQGIRQEPRRLLRQAGYVIHEMPDSDRCCGSAGIYNLTHPEMAQRLLERKVEDIPRDVEWVAAANPGCLMHIQSGLAQQPQLPPAVHPLDLIWQAYHRAGLITND